MNPKILNVIFQDLTPKLVTRSVRVENAATYGAQCE